ncbi:MAG: ABC transporter permease [Persicimonas sp.]
MTPPFLRRLVDEATQAWNLAAKDVRVYYLKPPMIMFGILLPVFLFFSFSVRRETGAAVGIANLLALTTFFTASSAGPVIIPMERDSGTYDRLLAAPMTLGTLLVGKTLVGTFFGLVASIIPLVIGLIFLDVPIASPWLLLSSLILASLTFSGFGLVFASIPARSVGDIMMPSTLVRWPLLFVSGVFIPFSEMSAWALPLAYISPLSYAQDLINHAVLDTGFFPVWLDLIVLPVLLLGFFVAAARLHHRSRVLGY